MKTIYKGFEIECNKEESLGGWINIYYYAMRLSDGYFFLDGFSEGSDNLHSFIKSLKSQVDDFINNPQDYEDNL